MIEVEQFYVGCDEEIYYKLKDDPTIYSLMDNRVLVCLVCETIRK
ncbi:unnamed protein product, partial [marine sediment metagenome]